MFYIIELFSNDLQELFDFVVNILSQYTTILNIKEKNGRWSASTQYFRLSVFPASGYASVIISLLKTILKKYSSDIVMFNTGYDALIVRKRGEIALGETDIPLVMDIERAIMKDDSE